MAIKQRCSIDSQIDQQQIAAFERLRIRVVITVWDRRIRHVRVIPNLVVDLGWPKELLFHIQPDPSRQEINIFWYAGDNPIVNTDPTGLSYLTPPYQKHGDVTQIPVYWMNSSTMRAVSFTPSISVGLAPVQYLPQNTNQVYDSDGQLILPAQYWAPCEPNVTDPNACGPTVLAMIFQANPCLLYELARQVTGSPVGQIQVTSGDNLVDITSRYSKQYGQGFSAVSLYYPQDKQDELLSKLRDALFKQEMPIVLVHINTVQTQQSRGNLVPQKTGGLHWVVVTGLSAEWAIGPAWQWVRVKNPYENQEEFYTWQNFVSSIRADSSAVRSTYTNLVIVSR